MRVCVQCYRGLVYRKGFRCDECLKVNYIYNKTQASFLGVAFIMLLIWVVAKLL